LADDAVPGQSYRVNEPDVIHQLFDREVVVVDLRNGSYYSLSESGGTAWLAFGSGGARVADVAQLLTSVYALPHDVAARDLQAFIAELTTRDLIVACPSGHGAVDAANVTTPTATYSPPELRSYNDLQELFLLDPVHEVDAAAGWPNAAAEGPAVPPPAASASVQANTDVDAAATGGDLLTAKLGGHTLLVNRDTGVYSTVDADGGITVHHDLETLMRPWIETDRPMRRAATAQGRQLLDRLEQSFTNDAATAGGSFQQWYRIGGHDVCVRTIPEQNSRRLRPALGHLAMPEAPASAAGLTISAWNGATPSAPPVLADLLRRLRTDWRLECGPRGEVLELHSVGISAIYNAGPNVLTVVDFDQNRGWLLKLDDDTFPYWEVGSPFRFLLHEWFAARGLQYVHAAAVGTEQGGVLLVGKGGSGKSTTALLCAAAGMQYAGDDYCLIDPAHAWAHSLYNTGKLKGPEDYARLPELKGLSTNPDSFERDGADKAVYFLDEIWPDRVVAGIPLRAIVVPRITGQATARFEPCSAFDAVVAMLPSTVAQLPAASNEDCDRMVALAEKLPTYLLHLGTDIRSIPAALTALLNG
jgi:hypothetical protein